MAMTPAQILNCGGRLSVQDALNYLACLMQSVNEGIGDIGGGGSGSVLDDVTWLGLTTFNATTLTGSYQVVLNDTHDKRYVEIYNRSDQDIIGSFDGTNDHFYLASGSSIKFEAGTNGRVIPTTLRLKHAGTVPTEGSIYISAYY